MTRNYKGLILIVFCLLLCFGIIYFCKTETKTISNKEIARTTVKFERDTLRLGQVRLGKKPRCCLEKQMKLRLNLRESTRDIL